MVTTSVMVGVNVVTEGVSVQFSGVVSMVTVKVDVAVDFQQRMIYVMFNY